MDHASFKRHLHLVKWLYENETEGCTTLAMVWVAMNDVVKFLHENRNEGCTEKAKNFSAKNGHLDIVKFLDEKCTVHRR